MSRSGLIRNIVRRYLRERGGRGPPLRRCGSRLAIGRRPRVRRRLTQSKNSVETMAVHRPPYLGTSDSRLVKGR